MRDFPGASFDAWKTTNPDDEFLGPEAAEPEDEEDPWQFFSGPFVDLEHTIVAVRYLDGTIIGKWWKFGVWPDPNTTTKWIIKRRPR